MKVFMGIITLAATVLTFCELGALAQGTADPVLLIIAGIVAISGIFYWNTEGRRA